MTGALRLLDVSPDDLPSLQIAQSAAANVISQDLTPNTTGKHE
jgi:hypothetical protein